MGLILPSDLKKKGVGPTSNDHHDPVVQQVLEEIGSFTRNFVPRTSRHNLSVEEREGLKWLKKKGKEKEICVCSADKGGALLLLDPENVREMIMKSLRNGRNYEDLGVISPVPGIM